MSTAMQTVQKYVLGLDLGSASLGWALIGLGEAGDPTSLIRAGVRIFEPGVDGNSLEIEQGKDQSKAVVRRTARLHRRQLRRRAARQKELFKLLQQTGLLPVPEAGLGARSEQRQAVLNELDRAISLRLRQTEQNDSFDQMPLYNLRKRALYHRLAEDELGRVFFHLSQRRGFKSNRKEVKKSAKEDEDLGQVEENINALWKEMEAAGAKTLGEYFAGLDPHTQKVRRRWTARKMFEEEFEKIWEAQQPHHPELLTAELRGKIWHLLFFQRPIAKQEHLIGRCELEPGKRRAPWASLAAQRFRILQKINDLRLSKPGSLASIDLTPDQRETLYQLLDRKGTQTFKAIRKLLVIPEELQINLERADKSMRGNFVQHHMLDVFAERWYTYSVAEQDKVVELWRQSESDEELRKTAMTTLGLDAEAAQRLTGKNAPSDYCSLSLEAIANLMPLMREGVSFKDAETQLYGHRFSGLEPHDLLPPVRARCGHRNADGSRCAEQHINSLRNPAVERALTEMRKVVNAIVREYGKPYEIRIELARELKKPRSERLKTAKDIGKHRKEREEIAARILKECGYANPSRDDIEKARLYDECGGECPYTGRRLPFSHLFTDASFDVEHIIPRSRYPDNSYQNKTLCDVHENREHKRNLTPWEAYGKDPQRWHEITTRVSSWRNNGKLKRFMIQSEKELGDFSARQMNDTRYTSVLAGRLLESLYGGRDVIEADGKARQVIFASSGAVTATLRRSWGFEQILQALVPPEAGETRGKPRTDHRHHAIDAIVIALTRNSVIQSMARASSLEPWQQGSRTWRRVPEPWKSPDFFRSIQEQIAEMVVSHRPEHKISGELHKGSNYSRPYMYEGKSVVHTRCALTGLTVADIEGERDSMIVDDGVRKAIAAKLAELGGDIKAFEKPENAPCFKTHDGRFIPIRKVRVRETRNPSKIGTGPRERWVASGGIHHTEFFVVRNANRKESWQRSVVQITEAYERLRQHRPVVSRELPDSDANFLFSLAKDDTVEMVLDEIPRIFRVKKFFGQDNRTWFVPVNDAHDDAIQTKLKISFALVPKDMRAAKCRKVVVDLLGRIHNAND
jgi:CRISPR-associated endonuclease Csn1